MITIDTISDFSTEFGTMLSHGRIRKILLRCFLSLRSTLLSISLSLPPRDAFLVRLILDANS